MNIGLKKIRISIFHSLLPLSLAPRGILIFEPKSVESCCRIRMFWGVRIKPYKLQLKYSTGLAEFAFLYKYICAALLVGW